SRVPLGRVPEHPVAVSQPGEPPPQSCSASLHHTSSSASSQHGSQARVMSGALPPSTVQKPRANKIPDISTQANTAKMFSLAHDSKLLGAGHVILNVIRVFNLIGLAAVMTA